MRKEKARTATERARKTLERLEKVDWELERRKQNWRIVKKRAEELILNVECRQARDAEVHRRDRAPRLIYKTRDEAWIALQEKKRARHREVTQRAALILRDHPGAPSPLVEKYLPPQPTEMARAQQLLNPEYRDATSSSESVQMTDQTKTTEKLSPLEALAEELGIVAAQFEREATLKIRAMKSDLELHFQRCIADQQKEISELRGMIKVLLSVRLERTEPEPIDFGEARAAVRN